MTKKHTKNQKDINDRYPDEGWHIPQDYTNEMYALEISKLEKIRQNLNDDEGFNEIKSQLQNIKGNIIRKKEELNLLVPPNKPNFRQRLYTFSTGKTNTADAEINDFNKKTKNVQNEIAELEKIQKDIQTLIPIYEKVITPSSSGSPITPAVKGGKRKTRRNLKKTKTFRRRS